MEKKDSTFKFNDTEYNIIVSDYESGFIKVSMQNIETKEIQDITIDAVHLFIPSAPTPDCAMVNDDKKLIKELIQTGILDYCHSLMAKFNIKELSHYDKAGVKRFLDKYAHEVTYRKDEGNSEDEVKKNIRKDAREILNSKWVKEYYLRDNFINMNTFLYSVLDKDNIKESFVVYADENGEFEAFIQPYRNNTDDQVEIIPDYAYTNKEGLFSSLNGNCQIIQLNKNVNEWIIDELSNYYPDFEYKKGVQKYLKYCISKKLDKEEYMKKYKDIAELMKKERKKDKER